MHKPKFKQKLDNLKSKIALHSDKITLPNDYVFSNLNSHSWFDIKVSNKSNIFDANVHVNSIEPSVDDFYTKKIILKPTDHQQTVLLKWMDSYTLMYNCVIKYFNKSKFEKIIPSMDNTFIKKLMKEEKNKIIDWNKCQWIADPCGSNSNSSIGSKKK